LTREAAGSVDVTAGSTFPPPGALERFPTALASVAVVTRDAYVISGEKGRGGLGRIFAAVDRRLGRPVAIKELLTEGRECEARFIREATLTARLQHPGVVPVHELGRWPTGQLFYSMKLVTGRSLKELITEKNTLEERLALLPNLIAVAEAVAYAHSRGVIHRDLKPSNVMIGSFGETVVIDWGAAKELKRREDAATAGPQPSMDEKSLAGAVVGTPAYMAPEQARGEPVDEGADVYALGAMLYHLLAGVPPYSTQATDDTIKDVIAGPPVPIEGRQPFAPEDLVTIVHKAMARDKLFRYSRAEHLAADLKRFQTGQLISARYYTPFQIFWHWITRHRGLLSVLLAFFSLALVAGLTSLGAIIRERNLARSTIDEMNIVQARTSLDRDPTASLAWLKRYDGRAGTWEQARDIAADAVSRGIAKHVLRAARAVAFSPSAATLAWAAEGRRVQIAELLTSRVIKTLSADDHIHELEFSPDGGLLAGAGQRKSFIHVWKLPSGERIDLKSDGKLYLSGFSPSGRFLATHEEGGVTRVWDLTTSQSTVFRGEYAAFSPISDTLAIATKEGAIELRNLRTQNRATLIGHCPPGMGLSFSPDGKLLASWSPDNTVRLWDLATHRARVFSGHEDLPTWVSFSPDGRMLASASRDKTVRIWDLAGDGSRVLRGHEQGVHKVEFLPNGKFLVSAGLDGVVRLWELQSMTSRKLLGHQNIVHTMHLSRDGRWLASTGDDDSRIWDLGTPNAALVVPTKGLKGMIVGLGPTIFSDDGTLLATGSHSGVVRVATLSGDQRQQLAEHASVISALALSHDNHLLASAAWDKTVKLWDITTGSSQSLTSLAVVLALRFERDRKSIILVSQGDIRRYEIASGRTELLRKIPTELTAAAFSPEGDRICGVGGGRIHVWDLSKGIDRQSDRYPDQAIATAFSPDGGKLAFSGQGAGLRIWNLDDDTTRVLDEPETTGVAIAFSSDGSLVAAVNAGGKINVWAVNAGRIWRQGNVASDTRLKMAFSPSSNRLAIGASDGTIKIWDVEADASGLLRAHDGYVLRVVFSPDGRILASAGFDGALRLWAMDQIDFAPASPVALRKWIANQTTMTISSYHHTSLPPHP
jgi:WD40 repeat protein